MINKMKILPLTSLGNLDCYIRLATSFPMLSIEEEKLLTARLYYNSNLEAAKILILFNLRFVIHIARNYTGYGLPQADLVQEGNIGLMKAIRRFNPTVGVRLVSFAVHWIKSEIHEYVLRNWRIVKVATTKSQRKLFFNLRQKKKRLGWFNKYELEMVAKELGVHTEDVREMECRMSAQDVSFSLSSNNDIKVKRPTIFFSYLRDYSSNFSIRIEKDNWKLYTNNKLTNALLVLDERSRNIIHARWLNEKNKITLQDIANNYGISAERVRQLEKNAMQTLKLEIEN